MFIQLRFSLTFLPVVCSFNNNIQTRVTENLFFPFQNTSRFFLNRSIGKTLFTFFFHDVQSTIWFSQGASDRLKQSSGMPIVKPFIVVMVLKWLQAGPYSLVTRLLHSHVYIQDKLWTKWELWSPADKFTHTWSAGLSVPTEVPSTFTLIIENK